MKNFVYKKRQEQILIDYIGESNITTKSILLDIKKFYNDNPYHNFLHALQVASNVLLLSINDFSYLEIKSLFYAALFHDALHTGNPELLDEFCSYDVAVDYLVKNENKIGDIDFSIIRRGIIGTVFKNRGKCSDKYAIILGDLDILSTCKDIYSQIYYGDVLCFELGVDIETWVKDFSFYKKLLKINKNVFISPYIKSLFPSAVSVIQERISLPKEKLVYLLRVLYDEDITLEEFKEKFHLYKV